MRGRHRRISAGTIAMILFAAVVLCCACWMIAEIRNTDADIGADAQRLAKTIAEMVSATETQSVNAPATAAPAATAKPQAYATSALQASSQTASPQPAAATQPQLTNTDTYMISLTIGGEIAFDDEVIAGTYNAAGNEYCLDETLDAIRSQVNADITIALLHVLPKMSAANDFAAFLTAETLQKTGFQYAFLNSENALAAGESGVNEMLSALKEADVTPIGLKNASAANTLSLISVRGVSVALIAYTDTLSSDSKKAVPDAATRENMINLFDLQQAQQDILAARAAGADIVLVSMHWGGKNDTSPTSAQRKTAQALCDAGADLIIGAHSDAVQPIEYLQSTQDPTHTSFVAWSMGTLLSASRVNREVVSGMLLHVVLSYDAQTGKIAFSSVRYTPTYCWGQKEDGLFKYRVLCSAENPPESMSQKQREIMGRALKLIQTAMSDGVAVQR